MTTKTARCIGSGFLLLVGIYFTVVAILFLGSVSSHGWQNVLQTGSVGLIALIGGALSLSSTLRGK
jgi:hypothetical protein